MFYIKVTMKSGYGYIVEPSDIQTIMDDIEVFHDEAEAGGDIETMTIEFVQMTAGEFAALDEFDGF